MAEVYSFGDYNFSQQDRVVFDTNVWLMLEGGNPAVLSSRRAKPYSAAYQEILTRKCELLLPDVVLSEFVNAWVVQEYNRANGKVQYGDRKRFRESHAPWPSIAGSISAACRKISQRSRLVPNSCTVHALQEILFGFENCDLDFNDSIIATVCRDHNAVLVTDDGDISRSQHDIIVVTDNLK